MKNDNATLIILFVAVTIAGVVALLVLNTPPEPVVVNNTAGPVKVTAIYDSACSKCPSTDAIVGIIRSFDVPVDLISYNYTSEEAVALIEKYGIVRVPVMVVSKDVLDYPAMRSVWAQLNSSRANESFVVDFLPPYRNLSSGSINGLVNVVYIRDASCASCYDVMQHRTILEQEFNAVVFNQTFTDVTHDLAKELIEKYNITAAPTVILSPDAGYYQRLLQAWKGVGSIEADGYFVFRNMSLVGVYRNLVSGKIINTTSP